MIPWTIAHQVPLSMERSRQEYWSGLPSPPPGDLLNPELNCHLLHHPLVGRCIFCIYAYTYLGEGNVKPTHILTWKIPLTKEPCGLQSKGSQRIEHDWETTQEHIHIHIYLWSRFLLRWNRQECLVSGFCFYFCFIIELQLIYNVLSVCWCTVLWFTYMYL